jgi:lipoate-protein ligase A
MPNAIQTIISEHTDPFYNLAAEELLREQARPGDLTLYLWQNSNTVVIGRNQDVWQECRTDLLHKDGGSLARRRSGGGAVYHDLGNLNYSFLSATADFNPDLQYTVVLTAVGKLGFTAVRSGRNDLTVQGRKFSGNAFLHSNGNSCHHGTILVNTDFSRMAKYLSVADHKLRTHGVASVSSRVINLCEIYPGITVDDVRQAMLSAFMEVYAATSRRIYIEELPPCRIATLEAQFASDKWRFNSRSHTTQSIRERFSWGSIEMHYQIISGQIRFVALYSDALETDIFDKIANILEGTSYTADSVAEVFSRTVRCEGSLELQMVHDICELLIRQLPATRLHEICAEECEQ